MTEDEQNKVYNTIGLAPNISMPVKGDVSSTTKSAIAAGTIDIRDNPMQDISALSRDTANSLNELGKIFDKAKIEEQQELAAVFGEEAFRLAHNLKDDGSGRKIAIHFAIGGIMSAITGAGFASGAIGAGLNEALIKNLKGLDPGTAQIVSAIVGAAAAKAVGGTAGAGASAAASGTKWNYFLIEHPESFAFDKLAQKTLKRKDGKELSEDEVLKLLQGVSDIFAEHEPVLSDAWNGQSENIKNYKYVVQYLMNQGITGESANDFLMSYNTYLREQIDWNVTQDAIGYFDASGNYVFKRSYNQWIQAYRPQKFWGIDLKTEDGFTRTQIIDDKNPNHTEERIHWGGWQHNPRIAENPKEEREGERADEGNTAATIRKSDVNKKDSKGSVLQDGQPSDKLESHSHTSPLEEQKGTNENHELKGNFDPVKETVQNALTNKEGILYGGIVDSDKTGMLSKNARIGLKIFGSAGGISGTILSGMDFVKDYHEYSGRDLVKVWGTDAFALAIGFGGSAIGGTLLGLPGAYVGGVLGGVGGAYVKSWLREGIKKDKEKAAAAYKDSERR